LKPAVPDKDKALAGIALGASASASVSAAATIKYAAVRGIGVKVWIPLLGVGGGLAVSGLATVASAVYVGYLMGKSCASDLSDSDSSTNGNPPANTDTEYSKLGPLQYSSGDSILAI
jgi:hypothetical protein